jgi:hypothetical protein
MQNQALFLLDPTFGYPFVRITTNGTTRAIALAVAVACERHFERPVKEVSTKYFEAHSTLEIVFKDGTDTTFIDVDYDEPEVGDQQPF